MKLIMTKIGETVVRTLIALHNNDNKHENDIKQIKAS